MARTNKNTKRTPNNAVALIENLDANVAEALGPEVVAQMTPSVEILEPEAAVEPTTELAEPLVIEHDAYDDTWLAEALAESGTEVASEPVSEAATEDEIVDATLPEDDLIVSAATIAEESDPDFEQTLAELSEVDEAALDSMEADLASETDGAVIEDMSEPEPDLSFEELIEVITPEDRLEVKHKIKAAFEVREKFEKDKSVTTGNDNIFKNLNKSYGKLSSDAVANVLLVTNVSPDFINRTLSDGSKYNVYALNKLADIAQGAMHGLDVNSGMSNAINLAVMKSMFIIRRLGATFTMDLAKAACSKQYRSESPYVKHLIRHTVSTSTVSTQSSSTMQALQTLGVVKLAGSRKNASYEIIDSPLTRRLEQVLMAA